jgi:hypothetical protein
VRLPTEKQIEYFGEAVNSGKIGKAFEKAKNGSVNSELLNPKLRNEISIETRSATPRGPPPAAEPAGI